MTAKPENYEELTRLVSALLESRLSAPERARLESLLQASPQARRLYMQMVDQEVELPCLMVPGRREGNERDKISPLIESSFAESLVTSPKRKVYQKLAAAAAVLLIGTALALVIWRNGLQKASVHGPKPEITDALARQTWSEDFENAARSPWYGRLVTNNLPPGSQYGITAVVREYPAGGSAYVIQLPEDWRRGLFALAAGSTLNVTYRLGNPSYVNIFMHTIPVEPLAVGYEMYQLKVDRFPGRPGPWQTASIPFSQFVRKVTVEPEGTRQFVGGPPRTGELVTTIVFSSVEPLDFVIDQVWVTATGPAREEIAPLPNAP